MIVRRGKSYGVSVYDPSIKRKRWRGTRATLREARELERAVSRRGRQVGTEDCASFAERWVDDDPRAAPVTQRTYRHALRQFAADFRGTSLAKIDRPTARAWALQQPQSNVRVVRSLFSDAINDGLHPGAQSVREPGLEQPRGRKDLIALTEEELLALTDCALRLMAPTGPRTER